MAEQSSRTPADLLTVRKEIELLGFIAGHSAVWEDSQGTLYVDVIEWRAAEAAQYWVDLDPDNSEPFEVGIDGAVGAVVEDGRSTVVSFRVENRSWVVYYARHDSVADPAATKEYASVQRQAATGA